MVVYQRRFIQKNPFLFAEYMPQLIQTPIMLTVPYKPTGRRLYDEIWTYARNMLVKTAESHNFNNRWWEDPNWEENLDERHGISKQYKPFIVKTVNHTGLNCSRCPVSAKCAGCIIHPTHHSASDRGEDPYIQNMPLNVYLAIDWNTTELETFYNMQASEVVEHSSVKKYALDENAAQALEVSLDSCLESYVKSEVLEKH